jgi:anti-sigma B factor antagonist
MRRFDERDDTGMMTVSDAVDPSALDIGVRPAADHDLVAVAGEIDLATAPQLNRALRGLLAQGRNQMVVDLDGVTFMDASALSVLVAAHRSVTESGGSFSLVSHDARCVRLMRITGLAEVFSFQ